MKNLDPNWFSILSDLFVNLSAGWFGAVFVILVGTKRFKSKLWLLTANIALGILALILAYALKRLGGL